LSSKTITETFCQPDITAPGVNILAAWSGATAPSKLYEDKRLVRYNIISGTSMACPHVAAAAALLRAIHPAWSSAAIRSALMTTGKHRSFFGIIILYVSTNDT
jgi:subtilisin family serine protease